MWPPLALVIIYDLIVVGVIITPASPTASTYGSVYASTSVSAFAALHIASFSQQREQKNRKSTLQPTAFVCSPDVQYDTLSGKLLSII